MEYLHGYYAGAGSKFSKAQKKEYAKEFAEGSKSLESLLLNLWNQGIDTISCCSGHDDTGFEMKPYISISIKDFDNKKLKDILKRLIELKRKKIVEGIDTDVDLYDEEKVERHLITIRFNEIDENNFKLIEDIFISKEKTESSIMLLSLKERAFIKASISLNSLDLLKYVQANPPKDQSYSMVRIEFNPKEEGDLIVTTNDRIYNRTQDYNGDLVEVAEGYYTQIKGSGEYITLKDGKVIPLTEKQAKTLPLLKRNKNLMIKYCSIKHLHFGQFQRDVIKEIERTIKKHEASVEI